MAIISVSRRTDIPAFYGDWFMDKIKTGFCETKKPFNNEEIIVPLSPDNVDGIVFWSKNYIPFSDNLNILQEKGYKFYLNYTVNNYPKIIEPLLNTNDEIIKNLIYLSGKYLIFWRYDPVYISQKNDIEFHINNFKYLCSCFEGKINRVIINFIQEYKKVINRLDKMNFENEYKYISISDSEKIELALEFKKIANNHGINLYSCSNFLNKNQITNKSSCVDKFIIEKLTGKFIDLKISPNYSGCHCFKSIDIGNYNSCKNNCIYCYANN